MGPGADRPPDGILDVQLEGRPKGELEIELRILPAPSPGPRLEKRIRAVARVARHCLQAAHRLFRPGFPEAGPPGVNPEDREAARARAGWGDNPRTRREFYRFFELLFRQLLGDVQREDQLLLRSDERLHVGLRWWGEPGHDAFPGSS